MLPWPTQENFMISDVLADAAAELEPYLSDPSFAQTYADDIRHRVRRLQSEMTALAAELDAPPPVEDR